MGFLSETEAASLDISRMILHVVGGDEFLAEPEQAVENADFFISRILETDVDPIHSFEEKSNTKSLLEKIFADPSTFEEHSQELSRLFSKGHVGASREGAFFIFELVTSESDVKLYSLLKFDYRDAIEQTEEDGDTKLRRIIHAFIADRKAVQKCALVRVRSGVADVAVGARDRAKLKPDIGDYFAAFLDVKRVLSNEDLNSRALEVVKDTFKAHEDILPDKDIGAAVRDAKSQFSQRQEINEKAIQEVVLSVFQDSATEDQKTEVKKTIERRVLARKIQGLAFPTVRKIYRAATRKRLRTAEGIELIYPDRAKDPLVTRKKLDGDAEQITILTKRVTEEKILGEETSITS